MGSVEKYLNLSVRNPVSEVAFCIKSTNINTTTYTTEAIATNEVYPKNSIFLKRQIGNSTNSMINAHVKNLFAKILSSPRYWAKIGGK